MKDVIYENKMVNWLLENDSEEAWDARIIKEEPPELHDPDDFSGLEGSSQWYVPPKSINMTTKTDLRLKGPETKCKAQGNDKYSQKDCIYFKPTTFRDCCRYDKFGIMCDYISRDKST